MQYQVNLSKHKKCEPKVHQRMVMFGLVADVLRIQYQDSYKQFTGEEERHSLMHGRNTLRNQSITTSGDSA